MHRKAVIFDVWETLVPLPPAVKRTAFEQTASALGTAPDVLEAVWRRTRTRRETRPFESYLKWLRTELCANWTSSAMSEAILIRRKIHGEMFLSPRPGSIEVLRRLRKRAIRTGAISNCTSDVRSMIEGSQLGPLLDCVILSAEVGIMKPDIKIYREAARRLDLRPAECIYIGDGSDGELNGAECSGMRAILLEVRSDSVWDGHRIQFLDSVLDELEKP
ncbi:HAD family hydrolase [Mycobacteroides abscessus]